MLTNKQHKRTGNPRYKHPTPNGQTGIDWWAEMPSIADRYLVGGESMQSIGDTYGVTREYIRLRLKAEGITYISSARHMRIVNRKSERIVAKFHKQNARAKALGMTGDEWREYLAKYGAMRRDFPPGTTPSPYYYYVHQRKNAIHNLHVQWTLTFGDWWRMWQKSGRYAKRGRGSKSYVLCRINHNLPFRKGNVCVTTQKENLQKGWVDKPQSIRGPKMSHDKTAKRRAWAYGGE